MTRQENRENREQPPQSGLPIVSDEIFGEIPVLNGSLVANMIRQFPTQNNQIGPLPGGVLRTFPNVIRRPEPEIVVYDADTLARRDAEIARMNRVFRCSNWECMMSEMPPSTVDLTPHTLTRRDANLYSEVHSFRCVSCGCNGEARVFF